jgi:hypothetical protein
MRARFVVPLTGLIAVLVLAGCGGGSSSSTTAASGASGAQGAALSKSEFLAQGNAICAKGNKAINQAVQQQFGNSQPSSSQISQFATQTAIPNIQAQLTALGALTPPAADADQVQAIIDAAQQGLDKVKSDPSLLTQQNNTAFADANKLASAYGLDQCAGG